MTISGGPAVVFYNRTKAAQLDVLAVAQYVVDTCNTKKTKVASMKGLDNGATRVRLMTAGTEFHGPQLVIAFLGRVGRLYGSGPTEATQVDSFLHLIELQLTQPSALGDAAAMLDEHLATRSFLVGDQLSIADLVAWATLQDNKRWKSMRKKGGLPNLFRWFDCLSAMPCCASALAIKQDMQAAARSRAEQSAAEEKGGSKKKQGSPNYDIDLPGAAEGKVVTRFPPEPSGFLHIGHAKAALLNHYFARKFKGQMILRFDDTNPAKEKGEFVDNIKRDLATLGVKYDRLTHTTDSFDQIFAFGRQMLEQGKAYVDDTPVELMRKMRMDGIASPNRDASVQENLRRWDQMLQGTEEGKRCVVRAKIDMQALNKTLRDPTMFRCNDTPHHRLGTKYKVYPTYDFACPIVDSIEGVTHALRTTEYHDRDAQYQWVCKALGIRCPHIYDFSRLAFMYSVMSKRKLQWFVDKGLVDGWYDPRFPTVQGIVRRGLTMQALQEFVYLQGASKNTNLMEWDKIWAINRKILDKVSHRYVAVNDVDKVPFILSDGPPTPEEAKAPLLPKDPSAGSRKLYRTSTVFLEHDDAHLLQEGEELTLMSWGNAVVDSITKGPSGVTQLTGHLHLAGSAKTTKAKLHWVGDVPNSTPAVIIELDHLIKVPCITEEITFEEALNPTTKVVTPLMGETALAEVKEGQTIQLQRRGFCRVDKRPHTLSKTTPLELVLIPDGKTKAMSTVGTKVQLKTGVMTGNAANRTAQ